MIWPYGHVYWTAVVLVLLLISQGQARNVDPGVSSTDAERMRSLKDKRKEICCLSVCGYFEFFQYQDWVYAEPSPPY